jgi:hypothetical protein
MLVKMRYLEDVVGDWMMHVGHEVEPGNQMGK